MPQVRQKRLRRRSKRKSFVVPGAGHYPHVEIPDAVGVRIVEFPGRILTGPDKNPAE